MPVSSIIIQPEPRMVPKNESTVTLPDGTAYHEHVNYGINAPRHEPTEDELHSFCTRVNIYVALYSHMEYMGNRQTYLMGLKAEEDLVNFAKSIVISRRQADFWLVRIKGTEPFTKLIAIAL